jgi:hypothetical protein
MPISSKKSDGKIVVADARGRVNLGADAISKSFMVKRAVDGEYTLVPMIAVPEREAWLWQNAEARRSFEMGMAQAQSGLGVPMDFAAFLDDDQERDLQP